jgi:hypothetical protein
MASSESGMRDGLLRNLDPKLEKFAVDARGTPQRISLLFISRRDPTGKSRCQILGLTPNASSQSFHRTGMRMRGAW